MSKVRHFTIRQITKVFQARNRANKTLFSLLLTYKYTMAAKAMFHYPKFRCIIPKNRDLNHHDNQLHIGDFKCWETWSSLYTHYVLITWTLLTTSVLFFIVIFLKLINMFFCFIYGIYPYHIIYNTYNKTVVKPKLHFTCCMKIIIGM